MTDSISDCIIIKLTKGYETIIDTEDADLVAFKWHSSVKRPGTYARRSAGSKLKVYLHRTVLERTLGRALIKGEIVDHINGNLDNRRSNLRLATHTQNLRSSSLSKNNTSGFKGVSFEKRKDGSKRWFAQITVDRKNIYLGTFASVEEASAAYMEAADKHFGEFARLK